VRPTCRRRLELDPPKHPAVAIVPELDHDPRLAVEGIEDGFVSPHTSSSDDSAYVRA
jgi:hypothetical protein